MVSSLAAMLLLEEGPFSGSAAPILLQKPSSPRSKACRASQQAKEEHKAHSRCLLLAGSMFQEQRRDPRDVAAPTGCRELQDARCCR